jgi:hypothetical protein
MLYVRATLVSGEQLVSQFEKVAKFGRFARDVFHGRVPFNVWTPVGDTHPASGERVLYRGRRIVNPRHIVSLDRVRPVAGAPEGTLDPTHFELEPEMQRGRFGAWTCPDTVPAHAPEGLVAGASYPVHRDTTGYGERYVVARAAQMVNGAVDEQEVRFFIDRSAEDPLAPVTSATADTDFGEDVDEGSYSGDDDEE